MCTPIVIGVFLSKTSLVSVFNKILSLQASWHHSGNICFTFVYAIRKTWLFTYEYGAVHVLLNFISFLIISAVLRAVVIVVGQQSGRCSGVQWGNNLRVQILTSPITRIDGRNVQERGGIDCLQKSIL